VERPTLTRKLEKLRGPPGFTGNSPGGPSRWSTSRSAEWEPLRPKLVVEVRYDHVTNHRFRHGTKLMRWRPDKAQTMQLGSNFPIRETLDFQKCRRYCGSIDNIRQVLFTKYGAGVESDGMGINRTSIRSLVSLSPRHANSGFGGRLGEKRERFALEAQHHSLYIMKGGSRRI
jgi:hypothetical protein